MKTDRPHATATIARHPIHAMFVPFPMVCFVGAFFTDLAYWATTNVIWETFSVWLLAVGLLFAAIAVIAGLIDFLGDRLVRSQGPAWPHAFGNLIALALSLINVFVHSRDGYTAVVPVGLILSTAVVVILLFTGWLGKELSYRETVGVTQ